MNQTTIALLVGAAIIAAAVLFANDKLHWRSEAESKVASVLADSDGAKFKNAASKDHPVVTAYCGSVNAKNRMGAYVGWSDYLVLHVKETGAWDVEIAPPGGRPVRNAGYACP